MTERELNVLKKLKECTHENIVKVIEIEKEVNTVVDFLGGFKNGVCTVCCYYYYRLKFEENYS